MPLGFLLPLLLLSFLLFVVAVVAAVLVGNTCNFLPGYMHMAKCCWQRVSGVRATASLSIHSIRAEVWVCIYPGFSFLLFIPITNLDWIYVLKPHRRWKKKSLSFEARQLVL